MRRTRAFAAGRAELGPPMRGGDEIAELGRAVHKMADEIEATQAKQSAFFNALSQLNGNQAKLVRAKIEDAEDEYAKRNSGEYATLPVWEAAQIILRKSGRAMTTREIVAALRDGGKQLGPKATSAVSAALKQGKAGEIFKPVKISGARQRWTLRDDGS